MKEKFEVVMEYGNKVEKKELYSFDICKTISFAKGYVYGVVVTKRFIQLVYEENIAKLFEEFEKEEIEKQQKNLLKFLRLIESNKKLFALDDCQFEYFTYHLRPDDGIKIFYNDKISYILRNQDFLKSLDKKLVVIKLEFKGFEE